MDEIEKQVREKNKEKEDEDRIFSPYTRVYPKEKTMPYIITGIVVIILVIIAIVWSIKQITIDNSSTDIIGVLNICNLDGGRVWIYQIELQSLE